MNNQGMTILRKKRPHTFQEEFAVFHNGIETVYFDECFADAKWRMAKTDDLPDVKALNRFLHGKFSQ
jgi:hypothetical protein